MNFSLKILKKLPILLIIALASTLFAIALVLHIQPLNTVMTNAFSRNNQVIQDSPDSNIIHTERIQYSQANVWFSTSNIAFVFDLDSQIYSQYADFKFIGGSNEYIAFFNLPILTSGNMGWILFNDFLNEFNRDSTDNFECVISCNQVLHIRFNSNSINIPGDWTNFYLGCYLYFISNPQMVGTTIMFYSMGVGEFSDRLFNLGVFDLSGELLSFHLVSVDQFANVDGIFTNKDSLITLDILKFKNFIGASLPLGIVDFRILPSCCVVLVDSATIVRDDLLIEDFFIHAGYLYTSQLNAPIIALDNGILSWEHIENASGYRVFVNDWYIDITTNTIDLRTIDYVWMTATIFVRAIGNVGASLLNADALTVSASARQVFLINYNIRGYINSIFIGAGEYVPLPPVQSNGNYDFVGWYNCPNFNQEIRDNLVATRNTTLYARFALATPDAPNNIVDTNTHSPLWLTITLVGVIGGLTLAGIVFVVRKKA